MSDKVTVSLQPVQELHGELTVRGNDGISPVIDVEAIEGGTRVSMTDVYGTKSFDIMAGADGHTPERGVDYWTEADKEEIAQEAAERVDVKEQVDELERSMESVLRDIADLKYVPVSITKFTVEPASAEMGATIQSVNLTYTINKTPAKLYLDGEEMTPASFGGVKLNALALTADKTWTLKAVDERNAEATKQVTLKFDNNVYYGVAANLTEENASALTAVRTNTRKRTINVNAAAGEYVWYCLPVRLGACTFTVGGFDGGFDLVSTQDVTNDSGYTESYNIYRSANAGLGSTTVEVK